jgi:uncharacterized Zn finger protein (UPF0148 family)
MICLHCHSTHFQVEGGTIICAACGEEWNSKPKEDGGEDEREVVEL